MNTVYFLPLLIVWVSLAALHEIVVDLKPWHHLGAPRGRASLLRELLKVRRGIITLHWLYSIVMVVVARDYFAGSFFIALPVVVWVIILAVAGRFIVRQKVVQERVLAGIFTLQQKARSLYNVLIGVCRVAESAGRYLVPLKPVVASKEELANFIDHQHHAHQTLTPHEKRQLEKMLRLDDRTVQDKIVPLKKALMVKAEETIGPLLLSDLHNDHHDAFLVYETKRTQPTGVLEKSVAVSHANRKGSVNVANLMSDQLVFLPETASLQQALVTFIETSSLISVIIDGEKQPVGVLYAQDILRDLFEKP